MESIFLVLAWPLLILVVGFLVIAYFSFWGAISSGLGFLVLPLAIIATIWFINYLRRKTAAHDWRVQAAVGQSVIVSFAIGVLVPLFVRELLVAADRALAAMIIGLLLGFALLVWGMFLKDNATLRRANLIGGVITILYSYTQLWDLGPSARIVAAAIGLVAAVAIGVMKFKDKLV